MMSALKLTSKVMYIFYTVSAGSTFSFTSGIYYLNNNNINNGICI